MCQTSRTVRLDDALTRLAEVRWGSAPDWDPKAATWLRAYYQRLAPWWPADRPRLSPVDRAIIEPVVDRRPEADRDRIEAEVGSLLAAADERSERIPWATEQLVRLVLAWAMAVDAGELAAAADPGEPLLDLFGAGFQIHYSDAGIELRYASGWMIARVPTRESPG